jgi:CHAT domain-containing protein
LYNLNSVHLSKEQLKNEKLINNYYIASLLSTKGEIQQAIKMLQDLLLEPDASKIYIDKLKTSLKNSIIHDLASCYFELNIFEPMEKLINDNSIDNNSLLYLNMEIMRGILYVLDNKIEIASNHFDSILYYYEISDNFQISGFYLHAIANNAHAKTLLGKFDEALFLCDKANDLMNENYLNGNDFLTLPYAYVTSNILRCQSKFTESINKINDFVAKQEEFSNFIHPEIGDLFKLLFLNYFEMKDFSKADSLKLKIYKSTVENFNKNKYGLSENEINTYKKDIYSTLQFDLNYALFRKNENPVLFHQTFSNYLSYPSLSLNILQVINQEIASKNDAFLKEDFENWKAGKQKLVKLYALTKEELINKGIDVQKEEEKVNFLEQKLSAKLDVFKNEKKEINWQEIQESLKVGEAYVQLVRLPYLNLEAITWTDSLQYLAFIITPETKENPEMVILANGNKLENDYFDQYGEYSFRNQNNEVDVESYGNYWKDIYTKVAKYENIYLSVDGIYNKINLNTLYDTVSKKYVLEQSKIHYVADGFDFLNRNTSQVKKANLSAILIGNPDFNYSETNSNTLATIDYFSSVRDIGNLHLDTLQRGIKVKNLPGTKTEIENINQLLHKNAYKTTIFTGKDATEKNIKTIVSPTILHIATHGYFFEDEKMQKIDLKFMGLENNKFSSNPMLRSGLLLAGANNALQGLDSKSTENGVLTAYESSYLNLQNTELVVLSACETGSGKLINGEGVYGLRKSFKDAGAKNIIMSLWKVDDKVTQEFMTSFYEFYLSGMTIKEAFNKTQTFIKSKYPQTYYWGAFVLVGE